MFRKKLITILFVALSLMGLVSPGITIALSVEERRSLNLDTVWWKTQTPNVQCTGGNVLQGGSNQEIVFGFLTGKGLSPENSAGFVGNMIAESGVDPNAVEGNGEGHGIVQWSFGRKANLFAFADAQGKQWNDLGLQLDFLWSELTGPYSGFLAELRTKTTIRDSAIFIVTDFERPANQSEAKKNQRAQSAQEVYDRYASTVSGGQCSPGAGIVIGDFVYYSQYDPAWANYLRIAEAGCGPTSLAMVVATLKDRRDITPKEVAEWAGETYRPGYGGSQWTLFTDGGEHYGLNTQVIGTNFDAVRQTLQAGGLVIASGTGAAPWTTSGHILVIRGIAPNGNFLLGDPNIRIDDRSAFQVKFDQEFSEAQLVSAGLRNMWAYTP